MKQRLFDAAATVLPPVGRLRGQRDTLNAQVLELTGTVDELSGAVDGLRHELADARSQLSDLREQLERIPALEQENATLQDRIHELDAELAVLRPEPAYALFPPGHFYSPIPDLSEIRERAHQLFERAGDVPGLDLHFDDQVALLSELAPAIDRWPYADSSSGEDRPDRRYQPDNGFFGWTDSQIWSGLLASRRPHKVIEIGSGWSTALLLDTCDAENLDTEIVAVEPYPERLLSVMRPGDEERITLLQQRAQDIAPADLAKLSSGDVLFIDSTHVSKIGSDVNHLVFQVFPLLPPGVLVHVHDIAYPFEYPHEWVMEGRAWNEAYILRAFLMDNPRWRVALWPSLLWLRQPDRMREVLKPGTLIDGGSLWLETT